MTEKPRCEIQSDTPGCATLREAHAYLIAAAQGIKDRVSMPAQDHGYNCLAQAAIEIRRLAYVEKRCAASGHHYYVSPYALLTYPLRRRRICIGCGLRDMVIQDEMGPDDVVTTDEIWAGLGGY